MRVSWLKTMREAAESGSVALVAGALPCQNRPSLFSGD